MLASATSYLEHGLQEVAHKFGRFILFNCCFYIPYGIDLILCDITEKIHKGLIYQLSHADIQQSFLRHLYF